MPYQEMTTAPRDGTFIEVMCVRGTVMPWWGLFHWADGGWQSVDFTRGLVNESYFLWRPFKGCVNDYEEPTGGLQQTDAYWKWPQNRKGVP